MPLTFITTVTNNGYVPFVRAHLESVRWHHRNAVVIVYYDRLTRDRIAGLRRQFPTVSFVAATPKDYRSGEEVVGAKIIAYCQALELVPSNSELVLIDCDTLLCKPIDAFFGQAFDVCFTWKEDGYPLNSGVILARMNERFRRFLHTWNELTQSILNDPTELARANEEAGAADQQALALLAGRRAASSAHRHSSVDERRQDYDGQASRPSDGDNVRILGVNCRFLNETHCCPITADTHVIHYKAGWHRILLNGAPFHSGRPHGACDEMFAFWSKWQARAQRNWARSLLLSVPDDVADRINNLQLPHLERGILKSELASVCAVVEALGARRIVETGRWLGHSTEVLASYFAASEVKITSIDWCRSEVAGDCERRLAPYKNLELYYGDAFRMMPHIVGMHHEPTVLLIDGPKGAPAVKLAHDLIRQYPHVVAAFLHDTYLESGARAAVEGTFPAHAFTDMPELVAKLARLDTHVDVGAMKPSQYTGDPARTQQPLSYGPTLALMLPSHVGDGARPSRLRKAADRLSYLIGKVEAQARDLKRLARLKYGSSQPGYPVC